MAFGELLKREIQLVVDSQLSSAEAHAWVANAAREKLAEAEAQGFGRKFAQMVDGVIGAPEESVRLSGGEIRYFFTNLTEAISFTLGFLNAYSPHAPKGRYANAWYVIVDNQPWHGAIKDIPRGIRVFISNYAPYAKRLEVGWGRHRRAGLYLTEKARSAVKRQFPLVTVERLFITLPFSGSIGGWPVPYISRRGPITYPALSISEE